MTQVLRRELTPPPFVLVVDDDGDLRKVVETRLAASGYDVSAVEDGPSALAALRAAESKKRIYDAVLLDLGLPALDGYEILSRILASERAPAVLILSVSAGVENRLRGFESGAIDFIPKPFSPEELEARIWSAVREHRNLSEAKVASRIDPLTSLGNRLSFNLSLRHELLRARRYRRPLSLLLLDANGLKKINDTYGHPTGDAFLRSIARAIRTTSRDTDRPARFGGDEFAVVLPETDHPRGERFRDRLQDALSHESYETRDGALAPTASIGLAVFGEGKAVDEEGLFQSADESLYRAKKENGV